METDQQQELLLLIQTALGTDQTCLSPAWQNVLRPFRQASQQAQTSLARPIWTQLAADGQSGEILARLRHIAQTAKRHYGELRLFDIPELDPTLFAQAWWDLIYGEGESVARFGRWLQWGKAQNLPLYWGLPTFFLAVFFPQTEPYIKSRSAEWLARFIGQPFDILPTATQYHRLRKTFIQLQSVLAPLHPSDLFDTILLVQKAQQVSEKNSGRLDLRAQIALGQPPDLPHLLQEPAAPYQTSSVSLTLEQLSAENALPISQLQTWIEVIQTKGQAIFFGPTGTGKTHLARQLAQFLCGTGRGFVQTVQFHPSYSYEAFVEGVRPDAQGGWRLQEGVFLQICRRAEACGDPSVLIIDEINRAPLPRVLGELLSLLEYRNTPITLASGTTFAIPAPLLILGTMNSADRATSLFDFALRRRFAFLPLTPNYALLRHYHRHALYSVEWLILLLQQLNRHIEPAYQLGTTPFLQANLPARLPLIWQYEVEPYLEDYFQGRVPPMATHWSDISSQAQWG